MYPSKFDYFAPTTLDEALGMLAEKTTTAVPRITLGQAKW